MQELYTIYAEKREKVSDIRAASAAAVFRACKERGCGRTIKEINKVLDPTVNMKKAISKAERDLKRTLQDRLQVRRLTRVPLTARPPAVPHDMLCAVRSMAVTVQLRPPSTARVPASCAPAVAGVPLGRSDRLVAVHARSSGCVARSMRDGCRCRRRPGGKASMSPTSRRCASC